MKKRDLLMSIALTIYLLSWTLRVEKSGVALPMACQDGRCSGLRFLL